MTKKHILIIHSSLRGGGAEKVLIDILKNFDYNKYIVDLFLLSQSGVYLSQIPSQVNVLNFKIKQYPRRISSLLVRTNLYGWLLKKQVRRFFKGRQYDTIISFMEGVAAKCHSYMFDFAKRNITWVHIDLYQYHYSKIFFPWPNSEKAFYEKIDDVIFVSAAAKSQFKRSFGLDKGRVIYNLIDRKAIIAKASEIKLPKEKFTIINVGRLGPQKRQDRIIEVASIMRADGYDAEFWILGEGSLKEQLMTKAKDLGVESMIKFLGFSTNPYSYIHTADIFLLTSDAEGFPLVVSEALCLSKPIVSTRITGPTEQLDNGKYGIMTGFNPREIADAIEKLQSNNELLEQYKVLAQKRAIELFDVEASMQQIYAAING